MQVVTKVMIPEAKPSLIIGAAIATTTILGYSAMAGIVGGGGLGDIAIRFGYYRYETGMMVITVVLLVLIVQLFQEVGMKIAQKQDRRHQRWIPRHLIAKQQLVDNQVPRIPQCQ